MTEREILVVIGDVAREHVGFSGTLSAEQRLVEDLDLDSIKALTLAVEVENRFRVAIDPDSEASIVTVGDLVRVVREKLDDAG